MEILEVVFSSNPNKKDHFYPFFDTTERIFPHTKLRLHSPVETLRHHSFVNVRVSGPRSMNKHVRCWYKNCFQTVEILSWKTYRIRKACDTAPASIHGLWLRGSGLRADQWTIRKASWNLGPFNYVHVDHFSPDNYDCDYDKGLTLCVF